MIKYLNGTKNLKLMLSADNLCIIKLFIDALYAIHNDCNGHTDAMSTLGYGAIAVDEALSQIL